jgi:APA family basic amino acid/polyamine antiporter
VTPAQRLLARLLARQPHDSQRRSTGPSLRRCLGIPGLIAVGLGTMLGGIFTTIGSGALTAGPGVIVSFLLSGLACVFVSLCYAELASMVPIAGSAYTYAYATLGEFVAWVIGWDLILEYGISVAPTAAAWSGYAQAYLQNFGVVLPAWAKVASVAHDGWRIDFAHSQVDLFAIVVVLAITGLLAVGIRESASTNSSLVAVQVFSMIVFVVALFGAIHPGNFRPVFPTGWHGVVAGAALVFFAYIGFDTVTVASEEARRPERDVPYAVVGSLAIGAVLYVAIACVTVGVVPWAHIDKDAGMADAVRRAGNNPWVNNIVTAGAIAGTTTVMTGCCPRSWRASTRAREPRSPRRSSPGCWSHFSPASYRLTCCSRSLTSGRCPRSRSSAPECLHCAIRSQAPSGPSVLPSGVRSPSPASRCAST